MYNFLENLDILLVSLSLSFILLLLYFVSFRRRPNGFPPGPRSLPIIGNLHQLGTRPYIKFMTMRKKYGDIFAIDFGSYPGVVITEAKLIREALGMAAFAGRPKLRAFLQKNEDAVWRGILINEGPAWLQQRRFTFKNLRDFGMGKQSMESIIQDELQELINTLMKYEGKPFRTKYIFNVAAVNSLWWMIIGERFAHDDKRLYDIVKAMTDTIEVTAGTTAMYFLPWLVKIAPNLSGFTKHMEMQDKVLRLIQDKHIEQKATFKSGQIRHFFDVLIQEVADTKDPTSAFYGREGEKNIVTCVNDMVLAGIETTSTTMSWSFLLLSLNPHIQDKMFEEVNAVVGLSRLPALGDQQNLPYIEAVLTEILRYSSIVPLSVFHSTVDDVEFHGFKIPKDTIIMPNLYAANHDQNVWGDPETFRPERFLTEDGKFARPGEAFMPFAVGKRVCIGESLARNTLFLFLANICQRFKIIPDPDKPTPVIDCTPSFVLQPKPYEYVLQAREP